MRDFIRMTSQAAAVLICVLIVSSCEGQTGKKQSSALPADEKSAVDVSVPCNRTVYGSSKYIKLLPAYICIPDGFVIDDFVRTSDLNKDGESDFLTVKYNKREDDQADGDPTYWSFYTREKGDLTYVLKKTLSNIVPPYIDDLSSEYLSSHPTAEKLAKEYPIRLSNKFGFLVNADTIRLSYKLTDTYGKTFVFVYDKSNWYLVRVDYFIGELPMYWWKENDFYYSLNDKLKVIESRKPKVRVAIDKFDLTVAFKYREDEWLHLAEAHIDKIDASKWSSIDAVKFESCDGIHLLEDWNY